MRTCVIRIFVETGQIGRSQSLPIHTISIFIIRILPNPDKNIGSTSVRIKQSCLYFYNYYNYYYYYYYYYYYFCAVLLLQGLLLILLMKLLMLELLMMNMQKLKSTLHTSLIVYSSMLITRAFQRHLLSLINSISYSFKVL